jgi:hypothetical protein
MKEGKDDPDIVLHSAGWDYRTFHYRFVSLSDEERLYPALVFVTAELT